MCGIAGRLNYLSGVPVDLWNLLVLELWHRTFIDSRPEVASDAQSPLARQVALPRDPPTRAYGEVS
jgi:hypothetical protein